MCQIQTGKWPKNCKKLDLDRLKLIILMELDLSMNIPGSGYFKRGSCQRGFPPYVLVNSSVDFDPAGVSQEPSFLPPSIRSGRAFGVIVSLFILIGWLFVTVWPVSASNLQCDNRYVT